MNLNEKFEKMTEWLSKDDQKNVKAEQIIRKNKPNGYYIDLDSLTDSQIEFIKEINS